MPRILLYRQKGRVRSLDRSVTAVDHDSNYSIINRTYYIYRGPRELSPVDGLRMIESREVFGKVVVTP